MAKRFIDTKMWDKAWFRKLSPKNKLIWLYLLTRCDHAGIWDADWDLAEFMIGEWVDYEELPEVIKNKMEYIKGEDQYFIPSFIDFQYGELKENSKPHLSVIKRLTEKGLLKGFKTLSGNKDTLKDKDKDKDKDKKKEEDKRERENKFAMKTVKIAEKMELPGNVTINFINYWTESNEGGRKMKFEMQKTFDIKRRLIKWRDNNIEWSKTGKDVKKSFESAFDKYSTGLYKAYCSKCGSREMPADKWQLKEGSNCCRVEYVPEKP